MNNLSLVWNVKMANDKILQYFCEYEHLTNMIHSLILLLDCCRHNNPDAEVAKRAILDDDQNLLLYTLAKNMNSTKIIESNCTCNCNQIYKKENKKSRKRKESHLTTSHLIQVI